MESGTSEWAAVMNRLEKLERQNRRFKQIGTLALVLAGSVLLMAQAPALRTVEANEFVLKDRSGKKRAWLGVAGRAPALVFYDANGKERATLGLESFGPALIFRDESENQRIGLGIAASPGLNFFDADHQRRALLGETTLSLTDKQGFETTIGTTNLVTPRTGETHETSAASVVLFDKDKTVLWKAP